MTPSLLELAEDPGVHAPPTPGYRRVVTDRYAYFAGGDGAALQRIRLADGVEAAVDEVRALAREDEARDVTWWCGELATPPDLTEQLAACGLVPDRDAPVLTSMAITHAPRAPVDGDVRRVESLGDYARALEINAQCS